MPEIISRAEAKALGLKRYFTGKPCKRGHVCERLISINCVECNKLRAAEWHKINREKHLKYMREWYDVNRESQSIYTKNKNAKNPQPNRDRVRAWRKNNPEKYKAMKFQWYRNNMGYLKEKSLEYRKKNAELIKAGNKKRYKENKEIIKAKTTQWAKRNRALVNGYYKKWKAKNPDKDIQYVHKRIALKKRAPGTHHTAADVSKLLSAQKYRCAYCRKKFVKSKRKWHVDHIVPLARGGSNGRDNIQILCVPCNLSKSARDPIDFAQSLGFLL